PWSEFLTLGLSLSFTLSRYISPMYTFLAHTAVWVVADYLIVRGLSGPGVVHRPEYWMAWVFREVTAFPLYVYSMVGNRVSWRGRGYRLVSDGTVRREDEAGSSKEDTAWRPPSRDATWQWRQTQEREVKRRELRRRESQI
ncbi:MAG: hypothetical protein SGCHY_003574, partial [Lobulomycetales sp.]